MESSSDPEVYVYRVFASTALDESLNARFDVPLSQDPTVARKQREDISSAQRQKGGLTFFEYSTAAMAFRASHTSRQGTYLTQAAAVHAKAARYQNKGLYHSGEQGECVFPEPIPAIEVISKVDVESEKSHRFRKGLSPKEDFYLNTSGNLTKNGGEYIPSQPFYIVSTIPPEHACIDGLRGGMCFYEKDTALRFAREQKAYIAEHMTQLADHAYHPGYTDEGELRRDPDNAIVKIQEGIIENKLAPAYKRLAEVMQKAGKRSKFEAVTDTLKEIYLNLKKEKVSMSGLIDEYRFTEKDLGIPFDFDAAFDKQLPDETKQALRDALNKVTEYISYCEQCDDQLVADAEEWQQRHEMTSEQTRSAIQYQTAQKEKCKAKIERLENAIKGARADEQYERAWHGTASGRSEQMYEKVNSLLEAERAKLAKLSESLNDLGKQYRQQVAAETTAKPNGPKLRGP